MSVTVWPGIGVPEPSSRVTVTVEEDVPLSATEMGLAATLEFDCDTDRPGSKGDLGRAGEDDPGPHVSAPCR